MEQIQQLMKNHFSKMILSKILYRSVLTGNQIWELYINGFENDPVFRDPNSSEHNCNLCNNFLRRYGNIVSLDEDYNIITIFDINLDSNNEYYKTFKQLSETIKKSEISNIFIESYNELKALPYESSNKNQETYKLGIGCNHKRYTKEEAELYGVVKANEIVKFNHFELDLPKEFVDFSSSSVESILGEVKSAKDVFKRGMDEISLDTLLLVKDLINQNSLLNGTSYLEKLEKFIILKQDYNKLSNIQKDRWCWKNSYKLPFAKFRNELIGTLCVELTEGKDLNEACLSWNKRIDPANYMKATAPITQNQIKEAKKFVEENGYEDSFNRRFAKITDININEILHSNSANTEIKTASVFDNVKPSISTQHKRAEFDKVEEVNIEKFMKDILPSATKLELFLENSMESNLLALTTSNIINCKKMFKWDNNFSWTFKNNLTGVSQIKTAVKDRGGETEGIIRASMHFPNTTDDYDLHMTEPSKYDICYLNRRALSPCGGMLDLDAQGSDGEFPPEKRVENIIYTDKNRLNKGIYSLYVDNFSNNGFKHKFNIEIEIEGNITLLEYNKTQSNRKLQICKIKFDGNNFELDINNDFTVLSTNTVIKTIWNLETNKFHKVNLVSLSPNHWGDNNIGNKHYLFMLDNCKSDIALRSFHVENLNADLLKHKKVMEILANTTMINPSETQLCGVGFNSTVKNSIIIKVSGSHKRIIKITI